MEKIYTLAFDYKINLRQELKHFIFKYLVNLILSSIKERHPIQIL